MTQSNADRAVAIVMRHFDTGTPREFALRDEIKAALDDMYSDEEVEALLKERDALREQNAILLAGLEEIEAQWPKGYQLRVPEIARESIAQAKARAAK